MFITAVLQNQMIRPRESIITVRFTKVCILQIYCTLIMPNTVILNSETAATIVTIPKHM